MDDKAQAPTTTTFLQTLRTQTSHLHSALEELPLSKKLTSESLSLQNYVQYLFVMQPVIAFTENFIFPMIENVVDDIEQRRKLYLINQDLAYLNVSINTQSRFFMKATNEAEAMGIMYVIEGSALGGRVILKNVQIQLGLSEENGASYFAGYRSGTSEKWKKFLGMLLEYENRTNMHADIIKGADTAFKSICDFMKREDLNEY